MSHLQRRGNLASIKTCHRCCNDNVEYNVETKKANLQRLLDANIITLNQGCVSEERQVWIVHDRMVAFP